MNKTEFLQFTKIVNNYYPEFVLSNSEITNLWYKDLSYYDFPFVVECLEKYVSRDKTRRPPSLGIMNDILKENYVVPKKESTEYRQNWADERFSQDIELGVCNYNRYIYQQAYELYTSNIELEFEDALKTVCLERTGHIREFPSQKELDIAGFPKGTKLSPAESMELLETYYKKGCVL